MANLAVIVGIVWEIIYLLLNAGRIIASCCVQTTPEVEQDKV